MKKFLAALISLAVIITSTSCIIIKQGVPESAEMNVVSGGSTISSGATVTSRVLSISGTVHNPGGATASTFEGYAYIVVNNDTLELALSYSTGNEWTFNHSIAIVRGDNVIVILVYDLDNNLYEKSPEFQVYGDFPAYPLRIQLTWDTDRTDVDLHVYYYSSTAATSPTYHTWYQAMTPTDYGDDGLYGIPNAYLDFDDTDGYGPENFTLEQLPSTGVFKAFLRYYSGYANTTATVKVYQSDTLVYTSSHTFTTSGNEDDPTNDWYFYTAQVVSSKINN